MTEEERTKAIYYIINNEIDIKPFFLEYADKYTDEDGLFKFQRLSDSDIMAIILGSHD